MNKTNIVPDRYYSISELIQILRKFNVNRNTLKKYIMKGVIKKKDWIISKGLPHRPVYEIKGSAIIEAFNL